MENSVGQFSSGGFLKWGYPKSSILTRFSIINHPFWGTSIYWTPHLETWRGCDVVSWHICTKKASQRPWELAMVRGTKWGPWGTPHIFFTPQVETKPNIANLRYPGKGVYVPVCHRIKKCPGLQRFYPSQCHSNLTKVLQVNSMWGNIYFIWQKPRFFQRIKSPLYPLILGGFTPSLYMPLIAPVVFQVISKFI